MKQELINSACTAIDAALGSHRKPALLCSFGKDSMVLLYMLKQWYDLSKIDLICFRQSVDPRKWTFADRIISEWNLNVISDIPPSATGLLHSNGRTEVINTYCTGNFGIYMPIGWVVPEDGLPYHCGKDVFLERPLGNYQWRWDLLLIGHKATDEDLNYGRIKIENEHVFQPRPDPDLTFPLIDWTDQDVWDFHKENDIPMNLLRYAPDGQSLEDKTFNPDFYRHCNHCYNKNLASTVHCPKIGAKVKNIHASFREINPAAQSGYIETES